MENKEFKYTFYYEGRNTVYIHDRINNKHWDLGVINNKNLANTIREMIKDINESTNQLQLIFNQVGDGFTYTDLSKFTTKELERISDCITCELKYRYEVNKE